MKVLKNSLIPTDLRSVLSTVPPGPERHRSEGLDSLRLSPVVSGGVPPSTSHEEGIGPSLGYRGVGVRRGAPA